MLNEGIKDNAPSSRSPKIYRGKFIGMYREDLYTITKATICGCRSRRYSTSFLRIDLRNELKSIMQNRGEFFTLHLWNNISAVNFQGGLGAFINDVEKCFPVAWCRLVQSDDSYLDIWTSSGKFSPFADPPNWQHRFFLYLNPWGCIDSWWGQVLRQESIFDAASNGGKSLLPNCRIRHWVLRLRCKKWAYT